MSAKELAVVMRIVVAADQLEDYLGKNVGTTADWPIDLTSDSPQHAEHLAGLLTELHKALDPYRACKTPLDNPAGR